MTTGLIFSSAEDREFLPANRMRLPEYVTAASEWFDENLQGGRVAALPETTVWADENGFVGFGPILTQIGTSPIIYPFSFIPGSLVSATNSQLNDIVYESLYRTTTRRVDEILRLMSVGYLNHETENKYWLYAGDTDSADWVRSRLDQQLAIEFVTAFGQWDVYAVPNALPRIYLAPNIYSGHRRSRGPAGHGRTGRARYACDSFLRSAGSGESLQQSRFPSSQEHFLFRQRPPGNWRWTLIPARYRHALPQSGVLVALTTDETATYQFWLRSPDRDLFPSGDLAIDGRPFDLSRTPSNESPFWILLGAFTLSEGPHLLTGTLGSAPGEIVVVPRSPLSPN